MKFWNVIQNTLPGQALYVESTVSGYCIFTKWESRAKLFTEDEAIELVKHLKERKPKNYYAKIQAVVHDDKEVRFTPPGNKASDHGSDPEVKQDRID